MLATDIRDAFNNLNVETKELNVNITMKNFITFFKGKTTMNDNVLGGLYRNDYFGHLSSWKDSQVKRLLCTLLGNNILVINILLPHNNAHNNVVLMNDEELQRQLELISLDINPRWRGHAPPRQHQQHQQKQQQQQQPLPMMMLMPPPSPLDILFDNAVVIVEQQHHQQQQQQQELMDVDDDSVMTRAVALGAAQMETAANNLTHAAAALLGHNNNSDEKRTAAAAAAIAAIKCAAIAACCAATAISEAADKMLTEDGDRGGVSHQHLVGGTMWMTETKTTTMSMLPTSLLWQPLLLLLLMF